MLQRVCDITKGFPRPRIGHLGATRQRFVFLASPSSDFMTGTCIRVDDVQDGR
ncbi:hypothetical protein ACVWWG_009193 [Bradyrhizobium sp. LB7.2]